MFIHIGESKVVRARDIIGIFDMDSATVSLVSRKYLSSAQKQGRVKSLGFDLPRSFIVMRDKTVYLSSITFKKHEL